VFSAIFESFHRWEGVPRFDVVEVDDLDGEALRYGVLHYVGTTAGYGNEYFFHTRVSLLFGAYVQKDTTLK
jgi:hypothetical protein